jgi:hypothetical protein
MADNWELDDFFLKIHLAGDDEFISTIIHPSTNQPSWMIFVSLG